MRTLISPKQFCNASPGVRPLWGTSADCCKILGVDIFLWNGRGILASTKWDASKDMEQIYKALLIMCRPPMAVHLDSLLNSVTRSREPSHANSSLPRCETFGLSATVISTAFPRLALSPRTEGKKHGSLFGCWRQSVYTFYRTSNRKKDTDWKLTVSKILRVTGAYFKNPLQG